MRHDVQASFSFILVPWVHGPVTHKATVGELLEALKQAGRDRPVHSVPQMALDSFSDKLNVMSF